MFDGGTDWSHPDLIGAKVAKAANGWPAAFDPFGTLQWLAAPSQIDQGLSWYVKHHAGHLRHRRQLYGQLRDQDRSVTKPGEPAGNQHPHLHLPGAAGRSPGTVRLGSHPDDYALDFFGERPAFLVTDPHTAGVYDTIYVDLNDDHSFTDEKPVTKASPRSWRDLDGDGYVDLSGGMAYYISDGTGADGTPVPGRADDFGATIKGTPVRSSHGPATSIPASRAMARSAPAMSSARA